MDGVALRLHGPLQAWGGPTIGDNRPTLSFPTRSGVLGLVAACLGIRRAEQGRLLALADGARVHIRVDSPGVPMVDDQTIQDNPNASETRQTIQSKRTYLCDASFVAVVVPGASSTVAAIAAAIAAPVFSPSLGRRCCPPSLPLLASALVTGNDPLELFESVPREPLELISQSSATDEADYYLDVDDHPRRVRRLPLRDNLAGPLPRQFRERMVVHVRGPISPASHGAPIDPWHIAELM